MPRMDPRRTGPLPRWVPVAEDVFCPAAAARGERGMVLLFRSAGGELRVRERDGLTWGTTRSLGVPVARVEGSLALAPVDWPIAACGTGDGDVHVVARGAEGELLHGRLRGDAWSGFDSVGVPVSPDEGTALPMGLAGAPAACSRARGQLDVFAVGAAGGLLHTSWDGSGFSTCEALGGLSSARTGDRDRPVPAAIAAFAAGSRILGVVARGTAGDLIAKWWDGARWGPFGPLHRPEEVDPLDPALAYTSPLSGPPAACGGGTARADAFARGPRGDLLHARWDGKRWHPLESLGMPEGEPGAEPIPFAGGPVACVWGRHQLDVFACAADGKLYNVSWEG
jgi:hypothetical protein